MSIWTKCEKLILSKKNSNNIEATYFGENLISSVKKINVLDKISNCFKYGEFENRNDGSGKGEAVPKRKN